ncbi:hypothetical protein X975_18964, partial [Stegodyphus mimosarum]
MLKYLSYSKNFSLPSQYTSIASPSTSAVAICWSFLLLVKCFNL